MEDLASGATRAENQNGNYVHLDVWVTTTYRTTAITEYRIQRLRVFIFLLLRSAPSCGFHR
jgi:hypothetical protein